MSWENRETSATADILQPDGMSRSSSWIQLACPKICKNECHVCAGWFQTLRTCHHTRVVARRDVLSRAVACHVMMGNPGRGVWYGEAPIYGGFTVVDEVGSCHYNARPAETSVEQGQFRHSNASI